MTQVWDDDKIAASIDFRCNGGTMLHRVDAIAVATLVREDMQTEIDRITKLFHQSVRDAADEYERIWQQCSDALPDEANEWFEVAVQWRLKADTLQVELAELRTAAKNYLESANAALYAAGPCTVCGGHEEHEGECDLRKNALALGEKLNAEFDALRRRD